MGTLRFTFTLTILLGHIYSIFGFRYHELVSSPIAFESFFLLSGFFMTMVWQNDYSPLQGNFKKFLVKRVLRIYPLYWLILAITIIASLITYTTLGDPLLLQAIFTHWKDLSWPVQAYVLFSNIFIFGQEALFFVKINFETGTFAWSQKFIDGNPPLHLFLLVSQAWAISYILYFYLLLPLLNRFSSIIIFLLIMMSIAARFIWYHMGFQFEPWLCRFLPFEFVFFLAGMLSYRAYGKWKDELKQMKSTGIVLFIIFFAATCLYDLWHVDYITKQWFYYLVLCMLMPLFFAISKSSTVDSYLGQLAYPAYISNFIIIHLLALIGITNHFVLMFVIIATTLLFSVVLVRYIIEPLNTFALGKIGIVKKAV